jgi:hypothetical protein
MLMLIREGGFVMVFVLGFGLTALVAAVLFAVRPAQRKLPFVRGMSSATVFAVLSGICADFGATAHHLMERYAQDPQWYFALIMGLGESMAPGIIGFSLLSLVWLVSSMGERRLARSEG